MTLKCPQFWQFYPFFLLLGQMCRCAWASEPPVFWENESFLPLVPQLSLSSALLRLLSADGILPCSTSASVCCYHKIWFLLFSIFLAAELSWSSRVELKIHTLPPSRGEKRRTKRQPDASVKLANMNYFGEITLTQTFMSLKHFFHFIPYFLISIWQHLSNPHYHSALFWNLFLRTFCLIPPWNIWKLHRFVAKNVFSKGPMKVSDLTVFTGRFYSWKLERVQIFG